MKRETMRSLPRLLPLALLPLLAVAGTASAQTTFDVIGPREYELPVGFEPFNVFVQYATYQDNARMFDADGDRVEIRSHIGATYGKAVLAHGIRPDTLVIPGQFDHWATPLAKDFGVPSLNSLATMSMDLTDATGASADGSTANALFAEPTPAICVVSKRRPMTSLAPCRWASSFRRSTASRRARSIRVS